MKKQLFIVMIFCFPVFAAAINQNFYFRDTRSWNSWDATVLSADVKTTICGMFAQSEMTIVFKDTVSSGISDSLELICNFHLPQESAVDSMWLWINNKPEAAYLLDIWRAWQIYSSIVRVRRDPAFLRVSGSQYYLNVFPFKAREARTVKINFSSPLIPVGNHLALRLPLDFVNNSLFAPRRVTWQVSYAEPYVASGVEIVASEGLTVEEKTVDGKTVLLASAEHVRTGAILMCQVYNPMFGEAGYVAETSKGSDNEHYFSTVLDVGKVLDVKGISRKKILFIWNGVQTSYGNTTYSQTGNCEYYQSGVCHYYYTYNKQSYYYPSSSTADLEALSKFIGSNLVPGDSFNVYLNDGTIKSFSTNGFVGATNASVLQAASYVLSAPAKEQSNTGNARSFDELLLAALNGTKLTDSVSIVIIDRSYFYAYYSNDTTMVYKDAYGKTNYYHYTYQDQVDIDALFSRVNGLLPTGSTVYALAYPYSYTGNFKLYDKLTLATKGMIIPIYDIEYGFRSLGEVLMGKLYPANLTITTSGSSYVYDLIGLPSSTVPVYKPLFITGKIFGPADSIMVNLKGRFGGNDYSFSKNIASSSACNFAAPRQIWALRKTGQLRSENTINSQKEASELSFRHRLLTDYTAFLALEPGMDSLLTPDEQQKNGTAATATDRNRKKTSFVQEPAELVVSVARTGLAISIPKFQTLDQKTISLKIFDTKGRLVTDLTARLIGNKGHCLISPTVLSRGTYVVRLVAGRKTVSKKVVVSW
jgi:hypothetical protein